MTKLPAKRGRVAVIGAGPGGMAAALSVHQAGHGVVLFERYPQARPAGNILNLWPPPIKALGLLGVNTEDLGVRPVRPSSATPAAAAGSARPFRSRLSATTAAASSACCAPSCTSGCSTRCPRESCRSTTRWSASQWLQEAGGPGETTPSTCPSHGREVRPGERRPRRPPSPSRPHPDRRARPRKASSARPPPAGRR